MMKFFQSSRMLRARGLLVAAVVAFLAGGGCSTLEVEKAFHVGGKIAYDSFKASKHSEPR